MEIPKELIEAQKFTDEQVTAINGFGKTHTDDLIAETKKEYDGKATKDAEAILHDATKSVVKLTGIEHEDGQKVADFLKNAFTKHSETATSELDKAKNEYIEKAKNVEGNEGLTKELEAMKLTNDELLKKFADYDDVKANADKYTPLVESHNSMKLEVAFCGVKPSFPDTVNTFEAEAKWKEFKAKVLEEHDVELIDGESFAISKDNKHKRDKLKDLVEKDETLSKLLEGRQQKGPNGKETETHKIDGVPFDVPIGADSKIRAELIRTHLTEKGLVVTTDEYSKQFAELNSKILASKTA